MPLAEQAPAVRKWSQLAGLSFNEQCELACEQCSAAAAALRTRPGGMVDDQSSAARELSSLCVDCAAGCMSVLLQEGVWQDVQQCGAGFRTLSLLHSISGMQLAVTLRLCGGHAVCLSALSRHGLASADVAKGSLECLSAITRTFHKSAASVLAARGNSDVDATVSTRILADSLTARACPTILAVMARWPADLEVRIFACLLHKSVNFKRQNRETTRFKWARACGVQHSVPGVQFFDASEIGAYLLAAACGWVVCWSSLITPRRRNALFIIYSLIRNMRSLQASLGNICCILCHGTLASSRRCLNSQVQRTGCASLEGLCSEHSEHQVAAVASGVLRTLLPLLSAASSSERRAAGAVQIAAAHALIANTKQPHHMAEAVRAGVVPACLAVLQSHRDDTVKFHAVIFQLLCQLFQLSAARVRGARPPPRPQPLPCVRPRVGTVHEHGTAAHAQARVLGAWGGGGQPRPRVGGSSASLADAGSGCAQAAAIQDGAVAAIISGIQASTQRSPPSRPSSSAQVSRSLRGCVWARVSA